MARNLRLVLSDEDELKKRGYIVGALLGEGSYAKVRKHQDMENELAFQCIMTSEK